MQIRLLICIFFFSDVLPETKITKLNFSYFRLRFYCISINCLTVMKCDKVVIWKLIFEGHPGVIWGHISINFCMDFKVDESLYNSLNFKAIFRRFSHFSGISGCDRGVIWGQFRTNFIPTSKAVPKPICLL